MFKVIWDNNAPQITIEWLDEPGHCYEVYIEGVEEKPWFHEVKRYLEAQEYPEGASIHDKKFLRRFSAKFFLSNKILYKCNHDSTLLWCVDKREVEKIMEDMCDAVGELTWGFAFFVCKCFGLARVAINFYFIQKER